MATDVPAAGTGGPPETGAALAPAASATGMFSPPSFTFDPVQAAGALALAGIQPTGRATLPPPAPCPPELLRAAGLLDPDGRLLAGAEQVLRVAADPARLLSVVAIPAGSPDARELLVLHGAGQGPFVAQSSSAQRLEFTLLPLAAHAALMIDELLGLTAFVSHPGGRSYALDLPGYAALLTAADLLQDTFLRARIERAEQPSPPGPPFVVAQLEALLTEGLSKADSRWAVTAGRLVCPAALATTRGRLGDGVAHLQRAGLAQVRDGAVSLTTDGHLLASALGQVVITGGFTLVLADDFLLPSAGPAPARGDRFTVAHVSLFRTPSSIWIAAWAGDDSVTVYDLTAGAALGLVHKLLEPPTDQPASTPPPATAPRHCGGCGATLPAGARFCGHCGHPVATTARGAGQPSVTG